MHENRRLDTSLKGTTHECFKGQLYHKIVRIISNPIQYGDHSYDLNKITSITSPLLKNAHFGLPTYLLLFRILSAEMVTNMCFKLNHKRSPHTVIHLYKIKSEASNHY